MNSYPKRKRQVEIYFILYLAAIVLLLPSKKEDGPAIQETNPGGNHIQFSLKSDKTSLFCRLVRDSAGARIQSIDSVNNVYYKGNVEDVKFEFVVQDQLRNRKLSLRSDSIVSTKFFRMVENTGSQSASFFWEPPLADLKTKSFLVEVIATAKISGNIGNKENGNAMAGKTVIRKTQFSLNMIFIDEYYGLASNNYTGQLGDLPLDSAATQSNAPPIPFLGQLEVEPKYPRLEVVPFEKWTNSIYVFNLNPRYDLMSTPVISIDSESETGQANIADYTDNAIIIEGMAPSGGSMKVRIKLMRKYDSREAITEFIVIPRLIDKPVFSSIMYPYKEESINPKLPLLAGRTTKSVLMDGREVRAVSEQGAKFEFKPSIVDTGKVLYLERYIDDKLYGQKYPIEIKNYPSPVIKSITLTKANNVRIRTKSYGLHRGRKNFVRKVEVISGEIKWRELTGESSENNDELIFFQTFVITPKKNASEFKFKVRIADERNMKSKVVEYP